jgi:hypothetical protein
MYMRGSELFDPGRFIMKKAAVCLSVLLALVIVTASSGNSQFKSGTIDAVKLTEKDIPDGFMYGTVPPPYKKTLKENPWTMDKAAIKRLAGMIYPGGDYTRIDSVHVSIIAEKDKPYGDDIVCYVILYTNMKAAQDEIKKATEFVGFNSDRALVVTRDNLAVILFVDDIANFHYIQDLAKTISERIKGL